MRSMGEAQTISNVEQPSKPWLFKPGQVANPKGRPKGSRNKLGEAFIQALHDDFKDHGVDAIVKVRETKPDQYLKVVAAVIPQEVHHTVEDYDQLSDDDLRAEFIRAASAIQTRIEARGRDRAAGAIEGSAEEVPN
jgi:hypothetical protein